MAAALAAVPAELVTVLPRLDALQDFLVQSVSDYKAPVLLVTGAGGMAGDCV